MEIKEIPIKDIKFRENIRLQKDNTSAELMNSIKQTGLLQPVGVIQTKTDYTLIWGHRRLNACKNLGWKTIPAIIFSDDDEMSEEEFLIINSIENIQKKPNTLFELGRICNILRKTMSPSEIASRLSLPTTRVTNAIEEFNRIPKKWHKKIKLFGSGEEKKGDIPMETASRIGRTRGTNDKQRNELMELASKNDLTQTEIMITVGLIKQGLSIKEAYKKLSEYKVINIRFGVNKEKYNEICEELESKNFIDFLIKSLNKEVPNLAFKISSKQEPKK